LTTNRGALAMMRRGTQLSGRELASDKVALAMMTQGTQLNAKAC